jgi:DNA-binding SARP family transcriptional activator
MHNPTVSRPLAPLYKLYLFGRFRLERRDPQGHYHPLPPDTWDRQSPRRVLAYLLVTPGRHTLRDTLLEALCPDDDFDRAQAVLSQALSLIRRVLVDEQGCPLLLPRKATPEKPLILAGREQLWCDWDESQDALMQAQAAEQQGKDALPLWEQAYTLCQEEFLLEERYNDWCREVRERAEGDQRLCLLHLAACYEQQGRSVEAERLLRAWLSSHALDQDVLCRLMEVLAEQGRVQEALTWYQRTCEVLEEEGEEPDRRTLETMEWVRALQSQRKRMASNTFDVIRDPGERCFPFSHAVLQDIIDYSTRNIVRPGQDNPEEIGNAVDRRDFLREALHVSSTSALAPSFNILSSDLLNRFSQALMKPLPLDEAAFQVFGNMH